MGPSRSGRNEGGPVRKNVKAKGKDVDAFVKEIEPVKRKTVQALRALVGKQAPGLKETIKWGNVCWLGNSNVCWLIVYPTGSSSRRSRFATTSSKRASGAR